MGAFAIILTAVSSAYFALLLATSERFMPSCLVWLGIAFYNGVIAFAPSMGASMMAITMFVAELVVIALYAFCSVQMLMVARSGNNRAPAPWAIVLGAHVNGIAPSRQLRFRLEEAFAYWQANPDTVFILSGGQGKDEEYAEAFVMRAYLLDRGMPDKNIVCEPHSVNTGENMRNSKKIIIDQAAKEGVNRRRAMNVPVAIITNDFHEYRTLQIAQSCGLRQAFAVPARSVLSLLPHYLLRETGAFIASFVRGL